MTFYLQRPLQLHAAQVNVEEGKSGKEELSSTLVTFCQPDPTTNINAGTLFWMIK